MLLYSYKCSVLDLMKNTLELALNMTTSTHSFSCNTYTCADRHKLVCKMRCRIQHQLIVVVSLITFSRTWNYYVDYVHRLYQHLFKTYNPWLRSRYDKTVQLYLSLSLLVIQNFGEVSQMLVSAVIMRLDWTDPRLSWLRSNCSNIPVLNVPQNAIWRPPIVQYNTYG
jgi:hypothetical protein